MVTAKGRKRYEQVNVHRRQLLDQRLGEWDDRDLQQFVDLLARYNQTLEAGELAGSAEPDSGVGR